MIAVFAACGGTDTILDDVLGAGGGNDSSTTADGTGDGTVSDGASDSLNDSAFGDGAPSDGPGRDGDAAPSNRLLGAASRFAVLAGGTVTNANVTTITGDLGVYPSSTPIGTIPPVVIGSSFLGTPEALAGENAVTTAYNVLAAKPCGTVLTGLDLGGKTLAPGTYCFSTSAQLTGTLTLDAQLDPNAVWVFQIGSTLTTATAAIVRVINGGNLCNAFWQIGSSATLGTGTVFGGSVLAMASITLNTGTSVTGRVLGRAGSVTLDSNVVSIATCPPGPQLDGGDF
jgi:hypothetical protein